MESEQHISVLLNESVAALVTDNAGFYVDGTFGRGGHSAKILAQLSERGRLLAIDKDMQAIAEAQIRFTDDERFSIKHGSFAQFTSGCSKKKQEL